MKIDWCFDTADVARVKDFFKQFANDAFVRRRIRSNLCQNKPEVASDQVWEVLVGCLMTTQQKSGPDSRVTKFLSIEPFPLSLGVCREQIDISEFVSNILRDYGGIRRYERIGDELQQNFLHLEQGGWAALLSVCDGIRVQPSPASELIAARFVDTHLKGFGPKQARNLLQGLGLSRYEVPIDSRLAKRLNEWGFPVGLTATALGDRNYYEFVSGGFQRLAEAAGIVPCVLDAAIFTSFDQGKWTDDNVTW